ISLWVRSYAPWREHSRRLGSLPDLPQDGDVSFPDPSTHTPMKSWQFDGVLGVFSRRVGRRFTAEGPSRASTTPVDLLSPGLDPPCGVSWQHENRRVDTEGEGSGPQGAMSGFPADPGRQAGPTFLDPPYGASSWTVHQSIARRSDTSSNRSLP